MKLSRVPPYYGLRIYLIATIIYYLLVTPFIGVLFLKYAPQLIEKGQINYRRSPTGSLILSADSMLRDVDSLTDVLLDTTIYFNPAKGNFDTLVKPKPGTESKGKASSGPAIKDFKSDKSPLTTSFNLQLKLLLVSFIIGFGFNLPFKRYFTR